MGEKHKYIERMRIHNDFGYAKKEAHMEKRR